ncbi:hypothetical protein [Scytonema sp. NUACC26]|uniref:hypothetical protein n=1 Tax=Scytonema sp. NUACC26 TaxID=3140176 RepID=UPI0034DC32EE
MGFSWEQGVSLNVACYFLLSLIPCSYIIGNVLASKGVAREFCHQELKNNELAIVQLRLALFLA